ncbi:3'-5' exonuclease [Coralloluteibacterium stylophorae]|uniref:NERD domain-containing protein n=1 Tax=Coralloluteibacterium stylophorae TaxID=1776034 RepID=A0A8J7VQL4_9GAMM|nr:3'-5' exonuclease [Coralloluteibacterium stylophorae]MBS7455561.1 NERD domain-containing protein [Coralloluteibacterium stylophorae]
MATFIPGRNTCLPRMTAGERRFALRLEEKLEDDYLVWYDLPVGPRRRQPDFVLLHPNRGLLVLEVKDWKLETLHHIDRASARIATERGLVSVANPLAQARAYALELKTALERDPALRHLSDHRHAGKLMVPIGHGVVLTHITRAQFDAHGLEHVLPPDCVVCRDEMLESTDAEEFQERLWTMFDAYFWQALTLPQIDRIRWHLFPEIRVTSPVQDDIFGSDQSGNDAIGVPDLVRVMDLQQEQLARSLGDGHRVIHGVAGSGKTMILGYRCLHLAQASQRPILVLCYNRTLAARLAQLIDARGLQAKVSVRTFHAWCGDMLRTYAVRGPARPAKPDGAFFAAQVQAVIDGVDAGAIPPGQYGAVLVDEGHDFEPEWLQLVARMVDPATNSLLLLYDDAQSIYAAPKRKKFTFASVGIQAQGRTTILRLNYRNTQEILALAKAFAGDALAGTEGDEDSPHVVPPESAGRRGPPPEVIECASPRHEAQLVAQRIADALASGQHPNDIAVLYRNHWTHGVLVETELTRLGVPWRSASTPRGKSTLFDGPPAVKLVTLHSSKGLEFDSVFLLGLGDPPREPTDATTEARLVYVGMTRAMGRLVVTRTNGGAAAPAGTNSATAPGCRRRATEGSMEGMA